MQVTEEETYKPHTTLYGQHVIGATQGEISDQSHAARFINVNLTSDVEEGTVGRDILLSHPVICFNLQTKTLGLACDLTFQGFTIVEVPYYRELTGHLFIKASVLGIPYLALFDTGALFTSFRNNWCTENLKESYRIDGYGG